MNDFKRFIIFFISVCAFVLGAYAQNYNLPSSLEGTSGMIYCNDTLCSINDHNNSKIYYIDTIGNLLDSVDTYINFEDLEEISQDSIYIYLGDFGNNINGNRQDLKIYKILKTSLHGNLVIDSIYFGYSNQTDYSNQGMNNTDFDCEAMIVKDSTIYLFTKQWISQKTSLYRLENTSGNHIAQLISNYDIGGLITGATYLQATNEIFLVGYTKNIQPFYIRLSGFGNNENFFCGNVEKQNINLPFHQIEAIAHKENYIFYITNEKLSRNGVSVLQQLHKLDLSFYLSNNDLNDKDSDITIAYPIPMKDNFIVESKNMKSIIIYNNMGKMVYSKKILKEDKCEIDVRSFEKGEYIIVICKQNGKQITRKLLL